MGSKRVVVDLNKFKCVKILLESKAPYDEITEMTGCSKSVITRIKHAKDFDEYKKNCVSAAVAYSIKARAKLEDEAKKMEDRLVETQIQVEEQSKQDGAKKKDHPPLMQSQYQMNRLIEIIKEQNEILKVMSNKIAFIVDELTK